MTFPPLGDMTSYVQNQIVLTPKKFGVLGSYSRELLQFSSQEDMQYWATDQLALRLTTSVLSGRTINEEPEVSLNLPASWWQHLKHTVHGHAINLWSAHSRISWLWLWSVLIISRAVVFGVAKRPVRWTKVTAKVHFNQEILYPEIDMPAHTGRPVIYETLSVNYPSAVPPYGSSTSSDPSRFMTQHAIISAMQRDPEFQDEAFRYPTSPNPLAVLRWLESHGVNVDQLVKRQ